MRVKKHRKALESAVAVLMALPFLLPLLAILADSFLSDWELRQLMAEVGSFVEGRFLPLRIPPVEASLHADGRAARSLCIRKTALSRT